MAHKRPVRTREKTSTTGTGDIAVLGVVSTDNIPFSASMSVGDTAFVCVVSGNGVDWEEFLGTYSAVDTIQRTTTITNNSGTTAHINLTGNSRVFAIPIPSDFSAFLDQLIGTATNTFLVRGASSWGGLSPSSVTALLSAVVGDTGSGGTRGLVPAPGAGDAAAGKILAADGSFDALSAVIDKALGNTRGAIAYRGASGWALLAPGTSGNVLTSNGSGADPSYQAASGGGNSAVGWHTPATMATVAALPTNTYSNGTSGVGATLTGNSNGALTAIDGVTPVVGYRILVKNEATASHNGVYDVTQVGDASHPYILTRSSDFNASTNVNQADVITTGPNGTKNANSIFDVVATGSPIVLGTTGFTFDYVGVNYVALVDKGAFVNTNSYSPGNIVEHSGRRFLAKVNLVPPAGVADSWSTTFNTAEYSIGGTGNLVATETAGGNNATASIISTKAQTSGKLYFGIKLNGTGTDLYFGVATAALATNARLGTGTASLGWRPNVGSPDWAYNGGFTVSSLARPSVNDWIVFCIDLTNGHAWVSNYTANPGVWYGNNGTGDPVAGTNPFVFTAFGANTYVACTSNQNGAPSVVFAYEEGSQAQTNLGTPPSGSSYWGGAAGILTDPVGDTDEWIDLGADTGGLLAQAMSEFVPSISGTGLATWLNQGSTATFTDSVVGPYLQDTTTGFQVRGRTKTAPATPYTITACIAINDGLANGGWAGLGWYDGTKLHLFGPNYNSGAWSYLVGKLNTVSSYSANDSNSGSGLDAKIVWLRIKDDGTNISFAFSADGVNFLTFQTTAKASAWLGSSGYSNVVFFVVPQGTWIGATLLSWSQTSP